MLNSRLVCTRCGWLVALEHRGRCPSCGGGLEAQGEIWPARINREARAPLTRYAAFLPLDSIRPDLSLGEGSTPQLSTRLGRLVRGGRLDLKLETFNPNGSAVDRGAIACVARARALGFRQVLVTDASIAAPVASYAARAGLACAVVLPGSAPPGTASIARLHGARVIRVEENADNLPRTADVEEVCRQAAAAYMIERSDPFWVEGLKTLALEVLETCGDQPPHHIVLSHARKLEARAVTKGIAEWRDAGLGPCDSDVTTARISDQEDGGHGGGGPACWSIDRRQAVAARKMLAEEDGLALSEDAAVVVAAALKAARAVPPPERPRVVAVVDCEGCVAESPAVDDRSETCTLDDLPARLAAGQPFAWSVET